MTLEYHKAIDSDFTKPLSAVTVMALTPINS